MDWFPFVIALFAILVIREFMLWWSPSTRSPQQTDVGNANGAGVIVEAAQIRDETESRSAGLNVSEGAPLLKIEASYSPPLPYARKIKPEGQVVTHLERNEHGSRSYTTEVANILTKYITGMNRKPSSTGSHLCIPERSGPQPCP